MGEEWSVVAGLGWCHVWQHRNRRQGYVRQVRGLPTKQPVLYCAVCHAEELMLQRQ
jgi:hypothetical protein